MSQARSVGRIMVRQAMSNDLVHGEPRFRTPRLTSQVTRMPPLLLAQVSQRVRVWALLYAFVFFMVGLLPVLVFPEERPHFFATPWRWLPPIASIAVALLIAVTLTRRALAPLSALALGLAFQIAGSYGIAAAEYLSTSPTYPRMPLTGLSWVAVWMLSFTVTVPSPPAWALIAALASASAVPVVVAISMWRGVTPPIDPFRYGLHVVLPYLLVVLVAYVSARIVHRLGTELTRALDLGAYRLVERLGQGGMGEVWRARHRLLARPAAVKLIRPELLESASGARRAELRSRFEREAQTIAQLKSPHTIELFDYGVADDGAFYYVMELLDGLDLKALVERSGPVPVGRAVHLLVQVCHSLAEAHAAGIVHRDITPSNVVACRYGRDVDFVKVLDFGLVKPQAGALTDDGGTTREGAAAGGTPAFMSPEQALGQRTLDGRSDIYSVGCLAYWLVTGQVVFPGTTPVAALVAHTQTPPEPPSQRTELPVPASFDALVLACLAKSPADRPASAEELADRFESLPDVPRWTVAEARSWWDLHRPGT